MNTGQTGLSRQGRHSGPYSGQYSGQYSGEYGGPHGGESHGYELPGGDGGGMGYGGSGTGAESSNLFKMVHRLLRGRYAITVVLAAIVACAGAAGGWMSTHPKFKTVGQLRFLSRVPTPYPQQSETIWNFPEFVRTEVALIQSEKVLTKTMMRPEWRAAELEGGQGGFERLADAIDIRQSPVSSEIVDIIVIDADRKFTEAAVESLIRAYISESMNAASDTDQAVLSHHEQQQAQHESEIATRQKQITDIAKYFGTEDLTEEYARSSRTVDELRRKQDELERALLDQGLMTAEEAGGDKKPGEKPQPMTAREIALQDSGMAASLTRQATLEMELTEALNRYSEEHPHVKRRKADLSALNKAIAARVDRWNSGQVSGDIVTGANAAAGLNPQALKDAHEKAKGALERARTEMVSIGNKRLEIERLKSEIEVERGKLNEAKQAAEQLRAKAKLWVTTSGRVQVLSYGLTPSVPTVDKRKQLAAAGFVLGGGLPVIGMLLLGLVDRRFRYSDDASESGNASLLGILPVLPKDLRDEEQRAAAAHCVHQIRLLLQMSQPGDGGVFALTSPTSGDGKTSLALSLGLSFAATGSRTVLVDFDTVGTGLSVSMEVRGVHGVVGAVREGAINGHVQRTGIQNLWLLPSAPGDEAAVTRMSRTQVRGLIERLRAEYDVVLVDTGPILGSLEASMVAGCVDGMVMVVGRGQQHDYVKKAMERVRAVGGRLAGLVFNRATGSDFKRSVSSASLRSVRALPQPRGSAVAKAPLSKAGPVAQSIVVEVEAEDVPPGRERGPGDSSAA